MASAIPPSRPSDFRWLKTVDEAYTAMLAAINAAQRSIRFETYIYQASPIGGLFRDAFVRACQRGVQVKVLIDALGSLMLSETFWAPLTQAGAEFRWFNPLHLNRLGFRNHRKLLACDERVAFLGGFNIGPEYQGDGVTKGWRDLGLQVPGTLAKELTASFEVLFALADYRHQRFIRLRKSKNRKLSATPDGQLLFSAPGRGKNYLAAALLGDIRKAHQVRIISGYFLPPRPFRRALLRLARQGAAVQLLLAGKSDVPLAQMASHRLYQGFLRAGIAIYEYQPQILHSKLFVFDEIVYAGSANLDHRSLTINYELLARLQNPAVVAEAKDIFQQALAHSRQIDAKTWRTSRTFWSKLKERWAFFLLSRADPYVTRLQWPSL